MSEEWVAGFKAALLRYVQENGHPGAIEITDWDDSASDPGGCSTCHCGLEYEVDISFKEKGFKYIRLYTYNGKFTDLLYQLTSD